MARLGSPGVKLTRNKEGAPIILICIACGEIQAATMRVGIVCPLCGNAEVRLQGVGEDDG